MQITDNPKNPLRRFGLISRDRYQTPFEVTNIVSQFRIIFQIFLTPYHFQKWMQCTLHMPWRSNLFLDTGAQKRYKLIKGTNSRAKLYMYFAKYLRSSKTDLLLFTPISMITRTKSSYNRRVSQTIWK